jgi:hypothetical protein
MATCQIDPNGGFEKQAAITALKEAGFDATEAGGEAS